ncbi:MAG: hypothetical protein RJB39_34 [Candidatus Parcubacteria bacterium]
MKIHDRGHAPPYVLEGDIWWANMGDNVGQEINGKGKNFARPVYIHTKLSHNFYFTLPMTSKSKSGSWYVPIRQKGKEVRVCLHQARVLDYRRLMNKLGEVDRLDKRNIQKEFESLYIKQEPLN